MRMRKLQSDISWAAKYRASLGLTQPSQLRAHAPSVQRQLDEAGICAAGDSGDDAASLSFGPTDVRSGARPPWTRWLRCRPLRALPWALGTLQKPQRGCCRAWAEGRACPCREARVRPRSQRIS